MGFVRRLRTAEVSPTSVSAFMLPGPGVERRSRPEPGPGARSIVHQRILLPAASGSRFWVSQKDTLILSSSTTSGDISAAIHPFLL